MKDEKLGDKASAILGEDVLAGMIEWYETALDKGWDYVVFLVRRSYILALIMEKVTGKKMEENSDACFLTEASLVLHCEELAEFFRKYKRFPRILLCDETLIHGRNVNQFIEIMEKRLAALLPSYDEGDVRDALTDVLKIHVYARLNKALLLLGRYELGLGFMRRVDAKQMHDLSCDFSTLILQSGIANACYIVSEYLKDDKYGEFNQPDYVKTDYQNTTQYTKIRYVGRGQEKKAIFSLRIMKSRNQDGWRVLPFVFMPNIDAAETKRLTERIQEQMRNKNFPEKYIQRLDILAEIPGKRAFNELITLLLSQALLQDFNKKYGINMKKDDKAYEVRKLARHYNSHGLEDAEEMLNAIISINLFTPDALARMLEEIIMPERRMICVKPGRDDALDHEEQRKIKERVEDYFYKRAMEEEEVAYDLSRKPYFPTRKRFTRATRGCGFLLWDINQGCTEQEAKYGIAYFLQMMDAGALSLSSLASNHVNVVGFSQYANTGEQSLLIKPLQLYEWIPMIAMIEKDCKGKGIPFEEELRRYAASRQYDDINEKKEEIIEFMEELGRTGQKAGDWNGDYMSKVDVSDLDGDAQIRRVISFLNLQLKHIMDYKKYRE